MSIVSDIILKVQNILPIAYLIISQIISYLYLNIFLASFTKEYKVALDLQKKYSRHSSLFLLIFIPYFNILFIISHGAIGEFINLDDSETQGRSKHEQQKKKKKVNGMVSNDVLLYSQFRAQPSHHQRDFFQQVKGEDAKIHTQTLSRAL